MCSAMGFTAKFYTRDPCGPVAGFEGWHAGSQPVLVRETIMRPSRPLIFATPGSLQVPRLPRKEALGDVVVLERMFKVVW